MGKQSQVDLVIAKDLNLLIPRGRQNDLKLSYRLKRSTFIAPLKKGDELGVIDVKLDDKVINSVPLVSAQDIDDYKKLEELIKFPSVVGFRVIVDSTVVNSIGEIKKVVDAIEKGGMLEITDPPRKSSKGNYVSYTIPVKVTTPDNLKALYQKIGALDCVKHVI